MVKWLSVREAENFLASSERKLLQDLFPLLLVTNQGVKLMSEQDLLLEIGGESVSLAELAGIDMDNVAEVRTSLFPAGAFKLKVEDAKLDIFGSGQDKKAAIAFKFKCTDVLALTDTSLQANDVIDKFHSEPIMLTDPIEGLGRAKAFMADAGFKGNGKLQELLAGFIGTEFKTRITHRPDKKDTSRIYSNIGLNIGNWKVVSADEKLPD